MNERDGGSRIRIRDSSAWDREGIGVFLRTQTIPLRLACLTRRATPIVCSLWYRWDDDALWCATQSSARVVNYLSAHPDCGFEVAPESPPYRGVRGQGRASLETEPARDVLLALIDRYVGTRESGFARWLIARADREVAIRIRPTWLTSWDFAKRMRDG